MKKGVKKPKVKTPEKRQRKVLFIILFVILTLIIVVGVFFGLKWYFDSQNLIGTEQIGSGNNNIVNGVTIGEIPEAEWNVAPDEPKYMSIPAIGIRNARVENLGIKVGTTAQFDDPVYSMSAGWYRNSARPGGGGVGLYDGHYGVGAYQGVFTRLSQVKIGDEIIIERGDGKKFTYKIIENQTIPVGQVNMNKLMSSFDAGQEGIVLITCAGTWDPAKEKYDHRTTVRAVLI